MFKNPNHLPPDEQLHYYKNIFFFLFKFGFFFIVLMGFYSSCYQPHRIPTGSMIPTLMIGDYILVDKHIYGLRFPFTDIFVTTQTQPRRGDVIVFRYPENPRLNYIKRVIGLPGDYLEMRENRWIINNETEMVHGPMPVSDPHHEIEKRYHDEGIVEYHANLLGIEYRFLRKNVEANSAQKIGPIKLGPDEFFVVGDNRDFSEDSRHWGSVHRSFIRGKALFVWFNLTSPFSEQGFTTKRQRAGTKL